MTVATGLRSTLLALSILASLPAHAVLLPNPAPSDAAFRMYLLGIMICRDCRPSFVRESVTVNGSRIDLRAVTSSTAQALTAEVPAGSVAIISGQVPDFLMPPLRQGRYEVWVTVVPECLDLKACLIPEPAPLSAGSLEVKPGVSATHILNPGTAAAGKPFDLQLLGGGYSCATAFDSLATEVSGGVLTLTFHDYERPMGCGIAYEIFGPTFKLPALPAGTYTVRVERLSRQSVFEAGILEITGASALKEADHPRRPGPSRRVQTGPAASGSGRVHWGGLPFDFSGRHAPEARGPGNRQPHTD